MSRICVKNLPKHVAENRLREFFSQKGEVTDAKLIRTKDQKSRQFAFIGFRTPAEAEEAIKFFNNSYLDTCRIHCEVARKIGDPDIPRPWSRYSSKGDNPVKENNKDNVGEEAESLSITSRFSSSEVKNSKSSEDEDPLLPEFLQIMQGRPKSKLWANDTPAPEAKASERGVQMSTSKKRQEPQHVPAGERFNMENESASETTTDQLHETEDDVVSDMDYIRSRVKKNWSDSDTEDEDENDRIGAKKTPTEEVNTKKHNVYTENDHANDQGHVETKLEGPVAGSVSEDINNEYPTSSLNDENNQTLDNGRLFVRNLPYTTNEDELVELFSQFGHVSHAHLVVDKGTRRSKGIAYVLYDLPESAVRALEELDNSIFQGRLLHVMPARPQNPSTEKEGPDHSVAQDKKTFKQRRNEQRKESEAGGDTRSWNSLYMRQDTVVENIVRKLGISKSALLDGEGDDPAVQIALGETQVIAETKRALSSAGINITALEELASREHGSVKRSNNVILVKNLPYGSSEGDLAGMFGKFGSLDKIILPPTKALALVIFLEATEARAAFKGLSYKRYKDAPLYLEWAPGTILSPDLAANGEKRDNAVAEQPVKNNILKQNVDGLHEDDVDPDRVESRSVFVKNLNFKTSDESLKNHFGDCMKNGSIRSVKVKKHLKNGKTVSMGFGFIEFDSLETATRICSDLQGTVLDGHALILQLCHAKNDGQVVKKDGKDKSTTKLIVRNVAFEATEKDLRQLFSSFGQIKKLRLPMKFTNHRGFAFVEYSTKQEAEKALKELSTTHLYGRHLVIERAKEEESLEELRERTAAQFVDGQVVVKKPSKKRKSLAAVDESAVKFSRTID